MAKPGCSRGGRSVPAPVPTSTTAGSHVSPAVPRARSSNTGCSMADIAPIDRCAIAYASSTSLAAVCRRCPRKASTGTRTDTRVVTSARTEPASVAAIAATIESRCGDRAADLQRADRLEVDVDVASAVVDAELHERRARSVHLPGIGGDRLERNRRRQRPAIAVAPATSPAAGPARWRRSRSFHRRQPVATRRRCPLATRDIVAARVARSTRATRSPATTLRSSRSTELDARRRFGEAVRAAAPRASGDGAAPQRASARRRRASPHDAS